MVAFAQSRGSSALADVRAMLNTDNGLGVDIDDGFRPSPNQRRLAGMIHPEGVAMPGHMPMDHGGPGGITDARAMLAVDTPPAGIGNFPRGTLVPHIGDMVGNIMGNTTNKAGGLLGATTQKLLNPQQPPVNLNGLMPLRR